MQCNANNVIVHVFYYQSVIKTQNGCITYIKYINIGTLKEYAAGGLVIYAYFNDHSDPRRLLWQCFL